MIHETDPDVPVEVTVRASLLGMADALAARMNADREIVALGVEVDREAVLRVALEKGIAAMEAGLTMRILRQEHEAVLDPVRLILS